MQRPTGPHIGVHDHGHQLADVRVAARHGRRPGEDGAGGHDLRPGRLDDRVALAAGRHVPGRPGVHRLFLVGELRQRGKRIDVPLGLAGTISDLGQSTGHRRVDVERGQIGQPRGGSGTPSAMRFSSIFRKICDGPSAAVSGV